MNAVRALYIVPTDYQDLQRKGVAQMLQDRELESDFTRLITVHPWAQQNRTLEISSVHRLIEFREYVLPFCEKFKLLRYVHHLFHAIRVYWRIKLLLYKERIEFVRATDPVFSGLLAWAVTRFSGQPYGVSIHADYTKRFELDCVRGAPTVLGSRGIAQGIEKFVLQQADAVLPIRPSLADQAIRNGISAEKIRIIPHGIHTEEFLRPALISVHQRFSLPEQRHLLSFVGRLSKENYLEDLLKLTEQLAEKRSDFLIVVAGEGPERAAFESAIQKKRLGLLIKTVGFQPREVVIALRQASAVSLCLMGGFSLIEACAVGRPVIAYDVEWHSELIQTGHSGWLLPEHHITALTQAVIDCLDHPEEATRQAQAAQQIVLERHDIRKTSLIKKQAYAELLERRG